MKEFIEKLIGRLEEEKSDWNYDYNVPINKAIKIVNQLAEEYKSNFSEKLNSWIPCSERLPEPGKRYLVSAIWKDEVHNYRKPAVYDAVFGGDGLWHSHNYEPVSYEVIAWQPLPAPFESKGENANDRIRS